MQDTQAQATFDAVQSWVSPRLGTVNMTSPSLNYEGDTMDYTKRKLGSLMDSPEQDEIMVDADAEEGLLPTPAATTRGKYSTPRALTRADTPVMSNSSKKSPTAKTPPSNVKSPYVPPIWNTPAAAGKPMTPSNTTVVHQTPLSRTFVHECRLYHDTLRRYRQEQERIDERFQQTGQTESEDHIEQDFLGSLQEACYSRARSPPKDPLSGDPMDDEPRKEGNFWGLLRKLRQLGVEALFYDAIDVRDEVRHFLVSQAQRTHATPQNLVQSLVGRNAPLSIQRWHAFVSWLESCHDAVLPPSIARSRDTATTGVGLVDRCLLSSDRETEVTRAALNLVLAGRLEDAIEMASKSGLEYLAAQWSGGYASGKDGNKAVGNPRRALWQVLMWQKANQNVHTSSKEAVALAALLSNNVHVSLFSPLLRTWERSLYAVSKAVMGRLQDNLLHQHNECRREERPSYPGTEYKEYELQHLTNTKDMQDMPEDVIFRKVDDQPFAETQADDYASMAMKAFWTGKHEVQSYMASRGLYCLQNDEECLRFLAHLALYIDAVSAGSNNGLASSSEWKCDLVLQYLNYLGSREELWPFMVLYASYLPPSTVLYRLPELLVPIESQPARKELLGQMNRFLEPQTDRRIISKISELILAEEEVSVDLNEAVDMNSAEIRKMRVLWWYSLREDLYTDGLEYANKLLRHFLLHHKLSEASDFMQEMRPPEIIDFFEAASSSTSANDNHLTPDGTEDKRLLSICREHAALFAYLSARQAVDDWEEVIQQCQTVPDTAGEPMDETQWNEVEASIAAHEKRRKLTDTKRHIGNNLASAANKAIEQLDSVLRFDGGFLLDEDEEGSRRRELDELRAQIIPDIVKQFQDVCMRTAQWMSESLHDGVKRLGKDASSVIQDLDKLVDPKASVFSPSFWSQQALGVMDTIAAETYECLPVYTANDRREILSVMADNMVKHLKYNSEFA
jgi:hypothetical protein